MNALRLQPEELPPPFLLVGLVNTFNNRFQAAGDSFFDGVSWKQAFLLNCAAFFAEPPTIQALAAFVGSSHQNTRQLLEKLARSGLVSLARDEADRRKLRVVISARGEAFRQRFDAPSAAFMEALFQDVDPAQLRAAIQVFTQLNERLQANQGGQL